MLKIYNNGDKYIVGTLKEFVDRGLLVEYPDYTFKSLQHIKAYPDGRVIEISKKEYDQIKADFMQRKAEKTAAENK